MREAVAWLFLKTLSWDKRGKEMAKILMNTVVAHGNEKAGRRTPQQWKFIGVINIETLWHPVYSPEMRNKRRTAPPRKGRPN